MATLGAAGTAPRRTRHARATARANADPAASPSGAPASGWVPALLHPYRDLTPLRHDFPVVLLESARADESVTPLAALLDALSADTTADRPAGRLLEAAIRARLGDGAPVELRPVALAAAGDLGVALCGTDDGSALRDRLDPLLDRLPPATVVGCRPDAAALLVEHVWRLSERARHAALRGAIADLCAALSRLLAADLARSPAAWAPRSLAASVGSTFEGELDFEVLARALAPVRAGYALPEARRERIGDALAVLARETGPGPAVAGPFSRVFDSVAAAADAFRERAAGLRRFARAVRIAQLEVEHRVAEAAEVAARPAEAPLDPGDAALLPRALACLDEPVGAAERAALLDAVGGTLPIKVALVVRDVLLPDPTTLFGPTPCALGAVLASHAASLGSAFALQTGLAHLPRQAEWLADGLAFAGPALFAIYAGPRVPARGLPRYLVAAAAVDSRAMPCFVQRPAAAGQPPPGLDLRHNRRLEEDFPRGEVRYEASDRRLVRERVALTPLDALAADPLLAPHLRLAPEHAAGRGAGSSPPSLAEALAAQDPPSPTSALLAVDESTGALRSVLLDATALAIGRRLHLRWRALRDAALRGEAAAGAASGPNLGAAPAAAAAAAPGVGPSPLRDPPDGARAMPPAEPGAAYVESARCSSCDECVTVNPRMFAYDDDRRAYLRDPSAGPFADLVNAAERCKLALIHPGRPLDPSEPGLEDLLRRAEPFA